jgi:DNA invertase Pin-like site-specific DNA recombinase
VVNIPFPPGASLNAYCRDSGGDSQDLSVPQQESAIRTWCADHGFILVHIFYDMARPGSSVIGRQGFQDMMHHFRSPLCQEAGLVIWSYSRFARSTDDSQFFRADLRRRGYLLYSLTDPIPDGPVGRFIEAAIDWKSEQFLEDLSRDVKRGLHDLVLTHRAVPGTPPRGFTRQPLEIGRRRDGRPRVVHRWVPDPDLSPLVRLAFQMRFEGHSLQEINTATRLYGSLNSYKTFFTNPLYKGELRYADLIIPDYCPPVVEPDLWEAVQGIIHQYARRSHLRTELNPRRVASSYLLSGLSYCARCGSPHYGLTARQPSGDYYRRYACTRSKRNRDCDAKPIPANILETAVLDDLRTRILDPDHLDQLRLVVLDGLQARRSQVDTSRQALHKDLASVRRQIARVTAAIADAGHSRALLDKLQTLENEEGELLAGIARLDASREDPRQVQTLDHAALSDELRRRLEAEDPHELRHILRGIIQRILADRDGTLVTGEIIYYYPPVETIPKP